MPSEGLALHAQVSADNPPGFAFVFLGDEAGLPAENGELHLPGFLNAGTRVLAPYAIDDATDGLYALRRRPRDVFDERRVSRIFRCQCHR